MVVSRINDEINYVELSKINEEDLKKQLNLYELNIFGQDVIISIGSIQNTFVKKNVSYFPIYLITKSKKALQIGVFEIKATHYLEYFDDKGNLLIEQMDEPLIYSFVTPDYIEEHKFVLEEKEEKKIESKKEEEDLIQFKKEHLIPEKRKDVFDIIPSISNKVVTLKEESKKTAKKIRRKYQENSTHTWVQKYMKNPHYFVLDVDMNKDCLFSILKEVFQSIGQQTTIQKLRNKLGEKVSDSLYQEYRDIFTKYERIVKVEKERIETIKLQYDKIQKQLKEGVLNREQRIQLIEKGKELFQENEMLKQKKKILKEIVDEYIFMKDIHSVSDLRKKVKSCDFWKEEWCLPMLEYLLNIKFIVLNYNYYKENDMHNVLECKRAIEEIENNVDGFQPEFYILLEKIGSHYKILGYRKKSIFTFQELPYDLKEMIQYKCMEQKDNTFQYILDFQRVSKKDIKTIERKKEVDLNQPIYDKEIVFSFYEHSGDTALPGKGPNEKIPEELIIEFTPLTKEKQWRKKISNFWNQTFILDGKNWASVVHYVEGNKFKNENRDFYDSFSLDSGSDLSKDSKKAWYAANSKSGLYKGERLREESILPDSDFTEGKEQKLLFQAQLAKFTQNEELKNILLKTKNASLVHQEKKKEPEVYTSLMLVREKINNM
jgi:hypothetical protein